MYYSITGKVIFFEEHRLVVECGGVGYDIAVSNNTLVKLGKLGEEVTVYTYLQVQEDALRLFGFSSKEEKSMFEKLITISGVGAKTAVQILSGCDLRSLAVSIACGDISMLSKIKGIGKKTAERIVLELKDKIGIGGDDGMSLTSANISQNSNDELINDAVNALVSLGINKSEAYKAVEVARQKTDKLENIITLALRSFG